MKGHNYGDKCRKFGKSHIFSKETRDKISKALSGENSYWFGKHHSKETREKMSKSTSGENHPLYGKHHSQKTKIKMSKAHIGENNHNYGKQFSKEIRYKMSKAQSGEKSHMFGKTHSKETKIKISKAFSGENHYNWIDGRSFIPYGSDWHKISDSIRDRDDNTCQKCGVKSIEPKLAVHHIDGDKNNYSEDNLISLCVMCHTPVQYRGLEICLQ